MHPSCAASFEVHVCFCEGMSLPIYFACLGYTALFFANDDELVIKTQIIFFVTLAIGSTFLSNFPFHLERFLCVSLN